ncbi:MAG: NAD-dependent epimerase/dehydratase family protein [Caulobacteraceae bacterium]|nr:NAD-dependent epimerase/dehydratase family protein [Caulobacteraceae bacterium]
MIARRAAVTGATGFLGRYIVRALADAGWTVRILARRDPSHPFWRAIEPEVVLGDLADAGAMARLCDGADAVVHGAGLIKARSRPEFDQVNVLGVEQAVRTSPAPAHFVLVSSLAAREPRLSDYAASKRAGEDALIASGRGRFTIVRPPGVYGPDDRETFALFQAARTWPVLPVLGPAARTPLIHAADAAAQIAALAARAPVDATYALSDARPDGYAWREIMAALAASVGRTPRYAAVPGAGLALAGAISELASGLSGRAPIFTRGTAREFLHPDWSLAPAEQATGLPAPRFGLADGFAATAAWYVDEGWLQQSPSSS